MRFREKDWKLVAMHDPAFRRGLWYRVVGDRVELCAGREGGDAFASVASSPELIEVFEYAEAAAADAGVTHGKAAKR